MSQMNQGMGPGFGRQQPAGRPGQMTAVMRAMQQATGPKVLRIGLVQAGRIIEERIIKQRTSVTVGPSEKSMFVIQSERPAAVQALRADRQRLLPELPRRHDRPRRARDRHHRHRRAQGAGEARRQRVPGQAHRRGARQDRRRRDDVPLPVRRAAAGAAAPAASARRSRAGSRARSTGASRSSPRSASCCTSGSIGAMYSDWMDPVVNDDITAGLLDMVQRTVPPPVETAEETPTASATATRHRPRADPGPEDRSGLDGQGVRGRARRQGGRGTDERSRPGEDRDPRGAQRRYRTSTAR